MKQLTLSKELRARVEHGGSLAVGKRKTKRPVVTKRVMHIVLKVAHGGPNLAGEASAIHLILSRMADRFRMQTFERAICATHIHLVDCADQKIPSAGRR